MDDFLDVAVEMAQPASIKLQLMDIYGRVLIETTTNINSPQTAILDVSALSAGMYFLSLASGKHSAFRKVVKK